MKFIATLALLTGFNFCAQAQYEILGQWYNEEKTSKLEIYEKHGKFLGKIIWLETTTNSDGSSPRRDEFNPDKALRQIPLMDMIILKDLSWNEDDQKWENGRIYDPEEGKIYDCYCQIQPDGSLYFKGYVLGLTWLGRSTVWTRK